MGDFVSAVEEEEEEVEEREVVVFSCVLNGGLDGSCGKGEEGEGAS